MEELIANSGLHFKTVYAKLNPEEPMLLPSGKTLKYVFLESIDYINFGRVRLDVCCPYSGVYMPVSYVVSNKYYETDINGFMLLDDAGLPIVNVPSIEVVDHYSPNHTSLTSINSLSSYKIKIGTESIPAYELLLGKWLPVPMYEIGESGQSLCSPNGWCRVRIDKVGDKEHDGSIPFRFVWAFDTTLGKDADEGILRPVFLEGSKEFKRYAITDRPDLMFGNFLNIPDGTNEAPIGDYLVSLFGIDLRLNVPHKYKFLGYYVYLMSLLRHANAVPQIILYNKQSEEIPVDMSIDIGNSRTCAVLFEQGNFTKARMLRLRDMTEPWRTYKNAFDMRVVFRRADFGGDITQDKGLFQYLSLVRVGEEAKHLVYRSMGGSEDSSKYTNCSSPKRYLWDDKPYADRWELMVVKDDPTTLKVNPQIFIDGFTDHFDNDGTYLDKEKEFDLFNFGLKETECHYSRQSLMTFVMIEVLQQARSYINSREFRDMHGNKDIRRYLRTIIITCPTAMPMKEQKALRMAALNATRMMKKLDPGIPEMKVIPDPENIVSSDDPDVLEKRGWLYDEAFASQLVYLYAELAQRYQGKVEHFFNLKGHLRKDMESRGFSGNSLTIGTIDIGAGTTDVMITAYGQKVQGLLSPIPLYYDSFYTAGDDIIRKIIQDIILEGEDNENTTQGSIGSSLRNRIMNMSPDELMTIPRISQTREYREKVESIRVANSKEDADNQRQHLIQELMHHFFDGDSARQDEKDRCCRRDFCTQISVPMAQFFLELLKLNRPTRIYSFDDIFTGEKPANYLLDHFAFHFGFDLRELSWRFNPVTIGDIVRDCMEPLMKTLSVIMYAHHCDILVLSGRPTNLTPLTELMLKYFPISPNRLVLLNQYRVGRFFPLATEEGYFYENQKAVVAVGAEIGYQASTVGFNGLILDFSSLGKQMKSTAKYLGFYDRDLQYVREPFLSPEKSTANLRNVSIFPCFIGCKQFDAPKYTSRPLFAIYNHSNKSTLNIMLQRNYFEDREMITVEDVTDKEGETLSPQEVEIRLQTIVDDGKFWMDKGDFSLKIYRK